MTGPFVNELRTPDDVIHVGASAGAATVLQIRVQMAELWDTIRIDASADEPTSSVKAAAIDAFHGGDEPVDDFVVKLHGFEILHEDVPLAAAGVKDGSTLLVQRRRRRPVK
ncbi:MAG TPA: hypothetical protein VM939_06320 [Gemmatimonadaceae bacterium]|nr:hypothetical protein [Gemmatimonadaceae bacterium]